MTNSIYSEDVKREDMRHLVAASTHHIAGNLFVLRCQAEDGETRNYYLSQPSFEHLRSMIENTLIIAREEQDLG